MERPDIGPANIWSGWMANEFTGTVLIMDGKSDLQGDVFTPDSIVKIKDDIPVSYGFDSSLENRVGRALLYREGNEVKYRIAFYPERVPDFIAKLYKPCVGGFLSKKQGDKILEFTISFIGLASENADPRIKKLGEE